MSIGLGVTSVIIGAADGNLNSAADLLEFAPVKPVDVLRFGVIIDGSTASGTTLVLALDKRPKAGSDTDRAEIATLQPSASLSQGTGAYKNVLADSSPSDGSPPGRVKCDPGEELVVEVKTAAGVASTGRVFIEYIERPFVSTSGDSSADRLGNMTEIE